MQHACLSEKFLKKRWASSLSYIHLVTNCAEQYTGSVKCRVAVNLEYSYFLNGRISILLVLPFRVVYEYVIASKLQFQLTDTQNAFIINIYQDQPMLYVGCCLICDIKICVTIKQQERQQDNLLQSAEIKLAVIVNERQ